MGNKFFLFFENLCVFKRFQRLAKSANGQKKCEIVFFSTAFDSRSSKTYRSKVLTTKWFYWVEGTEKQKKTD